MARKPTSCAAEYTRREAAALVRHGLDERLEAIAEDCKREIMALVRAGKATLPAMEEIVQHHAARMDLLIADIPAALERAERHLSGDATQ